MTHTETRGCRILKQTVVVIKKSKRKKKIPPCLSQSAQHDPVWSCFIEAAAV